MNEIRDINDSLPAQLINIGKRVSQLIDERLNMVGLSNAKLMALHSIANMSDLNTLVTVTCIADAMNTTKSNVTAMVDRLIAEGLATREHSMEDRRAVVIALTKEGKRRYEEGISVVKVLHIELTEKFTSEEQKFLSCLAQMLPE